MADRSARDVSAGGSTTDALLTALRDPACYPHPVRRVRVLTTHISWVFLAGRYAYKLKRPMRLGFLDYSTLARRHRACTAEVRLNRRLAPDVYLGIVPIVREAGEIRVGGTGVPIEYAVQMRRLPQRTMLNRLLATGRANEAHAVELGRRLAAFHARAARARASDPGGAATIRHNTAENFAQLQAFIGHTITAAQDAAVRQYTEAFLAEHHGLLDARKADGWVRDGHGDLRSDNICVGRDLVIFDCIEFNRRFRLEDVVAEVAFLAMDLHFWGRPDLARAFVAAYATGLPVPQLATLLPFYLCYRALVRAKVESLRLAQADVRPRQRPAIIERARRYVTLATRWAAPRPVVVVVLGLSGSGKSALACCLAAWLGWPVYHSDVLRKELAGLDPASRHPQAYNAGLYAPDMTARTYAALLERAANELRQGRSVVLDATYLRRSQRDAVRRLAAAYGAEVVLAQCTAAESVLARRLAARAAQLGTSSDADWAIVVEQRRYFEPPAPDEAPCLTIETDRPLVRVAQRVCRWLAVPGRLLPLATQDGEGQMQPVQAATAPPSVSA